MIDNVPVVLFYPGNYDGQELVLFGEIKDDNYYRAFKLVGQGEDEMEIKNIFAKPIDRDIKGVIKVGQDDSANIKQELEEYVVARELQKHFADFFTSL